MSDIKDEKSGWVYFDVADMDVINFIAEDMQAQGKNYNPWETRRKLLSALEYDQSNRQKRAKQNADHYQTQQQFRAMEAEARAMRAEARKDNREVEHLGIMDILGFALIGVLFLAIAYGIFLA